MRVLVCGGRDYANRDKLHKVLDELHHLNKFTVLIQGGATGADRMAGTWAVLRRIEMIREPADWKTHGKAAGPIRNQKMIDVHKPQLVVAFPGGTGTADMVRRANAANIPVYQVQNA